MPKMKMTKSDYTDLKQKVKTVLEQKMYNAKLGLNFFNAKTDRQKRWSIYWIVQEKLPNGFKYYDYLKDDNIDTALKYILIELQSLYTEYQNQNSMI